MHLREFLAAELPEVTLTEPEGTYFAWLDFSHLDLTDDALRVFFEDEAHVILAPGHLLGEGGSGHARLNLATSRVILDLGLKRIAEAGRRRSAA